MARDHDAGLPRALAVLQHVEDDVEHPGELVGGLLVQCLDPTDQPDDLGPSLLSGSPPPGQVVEADLTVPSTRGRSGRR